MIYLLIFIILLFFSLAEMINVSIKTLKIFQNLVGIIFVLVAGLRYETGVDWGGYQFYFDEIVPFDTAFNSGNFSKVFITLDIGYSLLNSIVKMFGGGIQIIFFIASCISTYLLIKNLRYYTKYVLTGLLVYYCFFFFIFDLSGLRQGLAIQIIFCSLKYILNRDFKKFLIYTLVAVSIHWSALLILPFYFIFYKNISNKKAIIIYVLVFVIFAFKIKWMDLLIGNVLGYINNLSLLSGKVTSYKESKIDSRGWDPYAIYNFIRISIVLFYCFSMRNKLSSLNKYFGLFVNILLFEYICYFALYEFTEISERLRFFFMISEIILIPLLIFQFRFYFYKHVSFLFFIILIFINSMPYVLEFPSTIAYHPYQNYLYYKYNNLKSTGYERLLIHKSNYE